MKTDDKRKDVGISLCFIQQFDAERERKEGLEQWAAFVRQFRLLTMPCSETKQ